MAHLGALPLSDFVVGNPYALDVTVQVDGKEKFRGSGAHIAITFDRLGTLECRFAEPARKLLPSRWPLRAALEKFHA
jgi:hypothetical protein